MDRSPLPLEERPGRRERLILAAIVVVAVAVRLWRVLDANADAPNSADRLFGDEPDYDNLARGLLDGRWFDYPARLPLYPVFVAGVHLVSGRDYDVLLYVQAVVGAGAVVLTWWLGRRVVGPGAGLVAAVIVALHRGLAAEAARVHSENLYTPALLGFLILLERARTGRTLRVWAGAGVALGVVNLIRPSAFGLPIALGVGLLVVERDRRSALRSVAVLGAASLVTIAPWTAHNAVRYDTFLPLSTSVAVLWQGSPEYYDLYQDGRSYLSIWRTELNPEENGGHLPGSIDGDRWFTRRALDSIRDRPLVYAEYSAQKALWYWIGHPSADWYGGRFFSPRSLHRYWPWWEVVWILGSRLLPVAGAVALGATLRERRRLWPFYAVLTYFTLLHALLWAELRLNEPMLPLVAIVVGAAVTRVWSRRDRAARVSPAPGAATLPVTAQNGATPTMGRFSGVPPVEPQNMASPNENTPPSAATSQ
jgi:4-amino-4-deoxy-L-arabinose transferase-like glycosyltransferase